MFKKIILTSVVLLLWAVPSFAEWTLSVQDISKTAGGHIHRWKVTCTSDGDALSATDLLASTLMPLDMQNTVRGSLLMTMDVSPGTGSVVPDTTIDVTLSNSEGNSIYEDTAISESSVTTGKELDEDYGFYLPVFSKLYLTLNDIGTAGDQVTLYFEGWIIDK